MPETGQNLHNRLTFNSYTDERLMKQQIPSEIILLAEKIIV